jgi:integrase
MPRKATGRVRAKGDGFQALVPDRITGKEVAVGTFSTYELADQARADAMRDVERGYFDNPTDGRRKFGEYATEWMETHEMAESTREERQRLLVNYILPRFRHTPMEQMTPPAIRKWFADEQRKRPEGSHGQFQPKKAYKLLREICATAVVDGIFRQGNPCHIPKAGVQLHPERDITVATWPAIFAIADAVRPWRRALVIGAAAHGGRLGEWAALTRADVDLLGRQLHITKAMNKRRTRVKSTKNATRDGRRTHDLLDVAYDALVIHMDKWVGPEPTALVFAGPKGGPLRGSNWNTEWVDACAAVGISGLRFHDLRHVAGTAIASQPGAKPKDVARFLGQSTTRAADIYIHATKKKQAVLIAAMNETINAEIAEQSNVRALRP